MSFVIVAALFLRWAPTQGAVVVVLTGGAALVALGIGATQHHHYARGARAIARESSPAALVPVAALGTAVVLLGAAGLAVIAL